MSAQAVWLSWLALFLGFELVAFYNKAKGDTLSETAWKWFAVKSGRFSLVRRVILASFLMSLTVHLLFATTVVPVVISGALFVAVIGWSLWKER